MLFQTHRHKARTPEEEVLTSRIDGELDRLFVTQAHTSSLTGLFSALIFTVIILPHHLTAVFILWTLSMVALYLSRFFWLGSRLRKGPDGCRGAQVRSGIYFNIALMGVGWGCAAWTFIWPHELVTQLPFLMILLGILTLTPPILSTKPLAGYLFVLPLLAGLILRLHTEAPEVIFATSAVAVLLAAFALGVTHRHSYILRRGIAQRIEKESIFDRLVEAKLRAEESASAKSTFIATMSHEIRTPVNGLMGMLEILKDTELTSQQANYLNTASRSAESLLQLLNDILDYSKLEVGKLELDKIPFDWVAMTGEIAMMNRVLALDKGVGFHLEIPPEATSIVVGDPVRLRQILNNLLSNAMKFTSEGSIWLKVHVDNEDAKTVRLSFSVKDTGIGIEPEAQKRLFQKYQQASASTGARYGGSGLGLAISLQLAQLMGGTIRVESTPGKGSEFVLAVPFPKATAETMRGYLSGSGLPQRYRARVLVVEDDPISQRVAVLMLKSFGVTPTVVNSGAAAIERCREESFDLIFMDSHLPDMDGFSAASVILTSAPGEADRVKPMIVAMTGADTPEDRQRARESGIFDYIAKPVRKRDIRLSLEKWTAKSPAVPKAPVAASREESGTEGAEKASPATEAAAEARPTRDLPAELPASTDGKSHPGPAKPRKGGKSRGK